MSTKLNVLDHHGFAIDFGQAKSSCRGVILRVIACPICVHTWGLVYKTAVCLRHHVMLCISLLAGDVYLRMDQATS